MMRKTKIVCTIGPATDDDDIMRRIMQAGMNVARFNFSHGIMKPIRNGMNKLSGYGKNLDCRLQL